MYSKGFVVMALLLTVANLNLGICGSTLNIVMYYCDSMTKTPNVRFVDVQEELKYVN